MSENTTTSAVEPQTVVVERSPHLGYTGTAICFIFGMLCFLFWGNMLGLFGPDAGIVIGFAQLGVFAAYHICAKGLYDNGLDFDGTIFMLFAALFGGVGGLFSVGGALCHYFGVPYNDMVPGVVWVLSGFLLLACIPAVVKQPKCGCLFYVFGGLGLFLMGLVTLGVAPAEVLTVAAWSVFAAGVLGVYVALSGLYGFAGLNLPLGKPFVE